MTKPRFADRLRAWRARADHSRVSLAEAIGVHHKSVEAWELGHYLPRTAVLPRLAKALRVPIDRVVAAIGSGTPWA